MNTLLPLLENKRFMEKGKQNNIELRESQFIRGERIKLEQMIDGTEKVEKMLKR